MKENSTACIVVLIILVTALVLIGIGGIFVVKADASQDYPLKIWPQNENGRFMTLVVVDEDTGVNYVVVSGEMYEKTMGLAISPRYNADGSLYITD